MKRLFLIGWLSVAAWAWADDFVDDVYYSPEQAVSRSVETAVTVPYYNEKKIREIVFIPDDTLRTPVDTLAAGR